MPADSISPEDGGQRRERVFFALWPEPGIASNLHGLGGIIHAECGGRRMRRDTLHITLAFIGDVEATRLCALRHAAAHVEAEAFNLSLDRIGSWRHNRIAWVGTHMLPEALEQVAGSLADALRMAGFPVERRKFFPHVTLLRRIEHSFAEREIDPVEWRVSRFVLVRSLLEPQGARYEIMTEWPLTSRADDWGSSRR